MSIGVGQLPLAVIRPGTVDELVAALRIAAAADLPVVPRGGGMSYTDGYLPKLANSITVDLLRLDRVVDVNVDDGYVTVECGSTWKALDKVLEARGVRTPYWGPLSGAAFERRRSTVAEQRIPRLGAIWTGIGFGHRPRRGVGRWFGAHAR